MNAAERAHAMLIAQEMVAMPAFHVASIWIETTSPKPARSGYPTSVGQLCFNLAQTWGAVVTPETMALALETAGFKTRVRSMGEGLAPELAVNVARGSIASTPWRTERPNPGRWAWARDDAPLPTAR